MVAESPKESGGWWSGITNWFSETFGVGESKTQVVAESPKESGGWWSGITNWFSETFGVGESKTQVVAESPKESGGWWSGITNWFSETFHLGGESDIKVSDSGGSWWSGITNWFSETFHLGGDSDVRVSDSGGSRWSGLTDWFSERFQIEGEEAVHGGLAREAGGSSWWSGLTSWFGGILAGEWESVPADWEGLEWPTIGLSPARGQGLEQPGHSQVQHRQLFDHEPGQDSRQVRPEQNEADDLSAAWIRRPEQDFEPNEPQSAGHHDADLTPPGQLPIEPTIETDARREPKDQEHDWLAGRESAEFSKQPLPDADRPNRPEAGAVQPRDLREETPSDGLQSWPGASIAESRLTEWDSSESISDFEMPARSVVVDAGSARTTEPLAFQLQHREQGSDIQSQDFPQEGEPRSTGSEMVYAQATDPHHQPEKAQVLPDPWAAAMAASEPSRTYVSEDPEAAAATPDRNEFASTEPHAPPGQALSRPDFSIQPLEFSPDTAAAPEQTEINSLAARPEVSAQPLNSSYEKAPTEHETATQPLEFSQDTAPLESPGATSTTARPEVLKQPLEFSHDEAAAPEQVEASSPAIRAEFVARPLEFSPDAAVLPELSEASSFEGRPEVVARPLEFSPDAAAPPEQTEASSFEGRPEVVARPLEFSQDAAAPPELSVASSFEGRPEVVTQPLEFSLDAAAPPELSEASSFGGRPEVVAQTLQFSQDAAPPPELSEASSFGGRPEVVAQTLEFSQDAAAPPLDSAERLQPLEAEEVQLASTGPRQPLDSAQGAARPDLFEGAEMDVTLPNAQVVSADSAATALPVALEPTPREKTEIGSSPASADKDTPLGADDQENAGTERAQSVWTRTSHEALAISGGLADRNEGVRPPLQQEASSPGYANESESRSSLQQPSLDIVQPQLQAETAPTTANQLDSADADAATTRLSPAERLRALRAEVPAQAQPLPEDWSPNSMWAQLAEEVQHPSQTIFPTARPAERIPEPRRTEPNRLIEDLQLPDVVELIQSHPQERRQADSEASSPRQEAPVQLPRHRPTVARRPQFSAPKPVHSEKMVAKEQATANTEETPETGSQGGAATGGARAAGGGGSSATASGSGNETAQEISEAATLQRASENAGLSSGASQVFTQQAASAQANQNAQAIAAQQREQEHEKSQTARKLEENKESAKSNNSKQEFEQARKYHQQQQQRQRAGSAPQEPKGQQAQRYRQVQKSEEVKEQLEGTSDDHSQVACARCGFLLGGSADVNCPICSSDHADKIHQMLTQYRLSSDSWVSAVDTVVASPRAQQALPEVSQAAVELRYVPKIPKFAQLLRTVKE
ncbi:MAG: hypothetical protein U0931_33350 [Vulcanimicrobiota bacterium]